MIINIEKWSFLSFFFTINLLIIFLVEVFSASVFLTYLRLSKAQ